MTHEAYLRNELLAERLEPGLNEWAAKLSLTGDWRLQPGWAHFLMSFLGITASFAPPLANLDGWQREMFEHVGCLEQLLLILGLSVKDVDNQGADRYLLHCGNGHSMAESAPVPTAAKVVVESLEPWLVMRGTECRHGCVAA